VVAGETVFKEFTHPLAFLKVYAAPVDWDEIDHHHIGVPGFVPLGSRGCRPCVV